MQRRPLLLSALLGVPSLLRAQSRGPLRLGADIALVDSGLAGALQRAFARDTGLGVKVVRSPALALLDALAAGEVDAGLCNAPQAEERLEREGLVHDRRPVATGAFLLVGPLTKGRKPDPRKIEPGHGLTVALTRWRDAAADPVAAMFLSAYDGSGAHVFEQSAWSSARIEPQAPWYARLEPGQSLIVQARARGACAIVERGAWLAHGGAPLGVLVEGDPEGVEHVHTMRSFRSPHPAGKLFVSWITGAHGRSVVGSQRGYRAPAA
jgi:tungstate transport system substrate-binding protein